MTIKKNQAGALTAVGADVSGNTFTVDGIIYIGDIGDTIFNNYSNNIAASYKEGETPSATDGYNNVFGSENICLGRYNTIFGRSNNLNYKSSINLIVGEGNGFPSSLSGTTFVKPILSYSLIVGAGNYFYPPDTTLPQYQQTHGANFIYGRTNKICSNKTAGGLKVILGDTNDITGDSQYGLIGGYENTVSGNDFGFVWGTTNNVVIPAYSGTRAERTFVLGKSNTISTISTFVYGESNTVSTGSEHTIFGSNNLFNGNCSNITTFGSYNKPINTTDTYIFGSSNGYSGNLVNLSHMFIAGDGNTFNGNYLQYSYILGSNNAL